MIRIRHHLVGQTGKVTNTPCGTVTQVSQGASSQVAPDVGQVLLLKHRDHLSQVMYVLGEVYEESASHLKQAGISHTEAGDAGVGGKTVQYLRCLEAPGSESGVLALFRSSWHHFLR